MARGGAVGRKLREIAKEGVDGRGAISKLKRLHFGATDVQVYKGSPISQSVVPLICIDVGYVHVQG